MDTHSAWTDFQSYSTPRGLPKSTDMKDVDETVPTFGTATPLTVGVIELLISVQVVWCDRGDRSGGVTRRMYVALAAGLSPV